MNKKNRQAQTMHKNSSALQLAVKLILKQKSAIALDYSKCASFQPPKTVANKWKTQQNDSNVIQIHGRCLVNFASQAVTYANRQAKFLVQYVPRFANSCASLADIAMRNCLKELFVAVRMTDSNGKVMRLGVLVLIEFSSASKLL